MYTKNYFIDSDDNIYVRADSLIEINNIIADSNNITLRKVNVKPYELDKMYIDKDLTEDKVYQTIHQCKEREITSTTFYLILLNKIHPFYDGNGRTCKIHFANDNKINKLIDET